MLLWFSAIFASLKYNQYPETIDDQQHQMKKSTHLIAGESSLIYSSVWVSLGLSVLPIVCPFTYFVSKWIFFFFPSQRQGSASFSAWGGRWWITKRPAGEAQLRFHQDKRKGKLFTLTRRLRSPKHSTTNGQKNALSSGNWWNWLP